MNIGKLRDRVTVQTVTQTNASADSYGRTDTMAQAGEVVWADVEQIAGEKRYLDLTQRYLISYRVAMRWNSNVEQNGRLIWGSRYLRINDISGDKASGTMQLMCYEEAVN